MVGFAGATWGWGYTTASSDLDWFLNHLSWRKYTNLDSAPMYETIKYFPIVSYFSYSLLPPIVSYTSLSLVLWKLVLKNYKEWGRFWICIQIYIYVQIWDYRSNMRAGATPPPAFTIYQKVSIFENGNKCYTVPERFCVCSFQFILLCILRMVTSERSERSSY